MLAHNVIIDERDRAQESRWSREPGRYVHAVDVDQLGPRSLRRLLDAVLAIGSDLDLEHVLQRIVEASVALVDARYGAIGVLDEDRTSLATFITVGIDDATRRRIGPPPKGLGLLRVDPDDTHPSRVPVIADDPASAGFPPGHPPMTSYLGVPIVSRDQVFGRLYLTDKVGAETFSDLDQQLVSGLAAAAGVVIANAELLGSAQCRDAILSAVHQIVAELASADSDHEAMQLLADRALHLAHADLATVALPRSPASWSWMSSPVRWHPTPPPAVLDDRQRVGRGAAHRPTDRDARRLPGFPRGPAAGERRGDRASGLGAAHRQRRARRHVGGRPPTGEPKRSRTQRSNWSCCSPPRPASSSRSTRAGSTRRAISVLRDQERIARDLHDNVIQRLFGIGLSLQAAAGLVDGRDGGRLSQAIDALDATIRQIRSVIISLGRPQTGVDESLRIRLLDVCVEAGRGSASSRSCASTVRSTPPSVRNTPTT